MEDVEIRFIRFLAERVKRQLKSVSRSLKIAIIVHGGVSPEMVNVFCECIRGPGNECSLFVPGDPWVSSKPLDYMALDHSATGRRHPIFGLVPEFAGEFDLTVNLTYVQFWEGIGCVYFDRFPEDDASRTNKPPHFSLPSRTDSQATL